jgi:hypothetical protein
MKEKDEIWYTSKTLFNFINYSIDFVPKALFWVPLQKIWLFYKISVKHHIWDIYMPQTGQ